MVYSRLIEIGDPKAREPINLENGLATEKTDEPDTRIFLRKESVS